MRAKNNKQKRASRIVIFKKKRKQQKKELGWPSRFFVIASCRDENNQNKFAFAQKCYSCRCRPCPRTKSQKTTRPTVPHTQVPYDHPWNKKERRSFQMGLKCVCNLQRWKKATLTWINRRCLSLSLLPSIYEHNRTQELQTTSDSVLVTNANPAPSVYRRGL